jgi:hypothetical protein
MRIPLKAIVLIGVLAAAAEPAPAQSRSPQEFQVAPAASPIVIDGALDEVAWQQAAAVPLKYEIFPGDNAPARVETICYVTFDPSRLYYACRASDPDVSQIRANLTDRDVPFNDDTIGLMIDTFNDGRRAFQFRINARGVQLDAVNSDVDESQDWSWDAIWDAKAQIGPDGYTVEVAIPFSSLRFPKESSVQTWGFMAMRDMPRSTKYRMQSVYNDRNRSCTVCQFDKVSGFTAITPGRNLEFDPTATAARTDARATGSERGLVAGDVDAQLGLSARWSITPNIVLNGTLNPDFYQVEADAAQLDVNTQFQLFFPEKRPFFLEGADFFQTPLDTVFTRNVADPIFGVKLTGKEGGNAFGVFVARDEVTGIVVPGFDGSSFSGLQDDNVTSVFRYRRDLGTSGSTLGALYVGREGEGYSNRVGGIDGLSRLSSADSIRFQWIGSNTDYPDALAAGEGQPAGAFRGQSFLLDYRHGTRTWEWQARMAALSPAFRADAGFVPQVDTRLYSYFFGRTFLGDATRWFNELFVGHGCDRTTDWDNGRVSWGCDIPFNYSGPMQSSINYNVAYNSEYFQGVTYTNIRHPMGASIRPSGSFSLRVNFTPGGAIDFVNARRGEQRNLTVSGTYNLFGRLNGDLSQTSQSLSVAGGRLFTARLTQSKTVFHLNVHTFIRAILQFTDVDRNAALYLRPTTAHTRRLFSQFLFSYKLNPQTVALVGYSDNADIARTADLTRANRTFFTKIGYAWVP